MVKKLEIKVPSLGESITEATISKWFKKTGDFIEKDEVIAELETDKVTQEIYSTEEGKISQIFFDEGKDVKIGDILASIDLEEKDNKPNIEVNMNLSSSAEKIDLVVPSMGESIIEAVIGKWLVKEGDFIKKGDPIVELETDKVTQEVYAERDVFLGKIIFAQDKEVKIGEVIAILDLKEKKELERINHADDEIPEAQEEIVTSLELDPTSIRRSGAGNKIKLSDLEQFVSNKSLSPSAIKYINENDLETENIKGLESKEKLSKADFLEVKDMQTSNEESLQPEKEDKDSEIIKPLTKLRQSIAMKLKDAQNTAAMLTTFNEINMQEVINIREKYKEDFLKKYNVKLGFMSFFTKASIIVLKDLPEINAEIRDNSIIYKNRYDIGIAVGTDKGLYVPVLRNADKMSFDSIEKKILEYGKLAKNNKITLEHMKNGTFTISNGGVYGSMLSTPILNFPQSGILGLHNIVQRPVVIDNEILIRPIMYVALTYDHRIIDGKQAVTFLVRLKEIIENPEKIMFNL